MLLRDVASSRRPSDRGPCRHFSRLLLVATAILVPLQVWPATARASVVTQLRQPPLSQIASALDLAAENALPQGYPTLTGATAVPTVLLKAVAWVESQWRQFRAPNRPLESRDGGFGVMQITHGLGGEPVTDPIQSAIVDNFVYNIACGARLLTEKWARTPRVGTGDPAVLEDWYYAVWAYNAWGWRNNPNNPAFTREGTPATNPGAFPYQERVYYFVSHPPLDATGQPLWTAVPVLLPDAAAVGKEPRALAQPASVHYDVEPSDGPLAIASGEAMRFEGDLSLHDGAVVAPAAPMHKVWLLRNTGGSFWSGYSWRFVGGDQLRAPTSIAVPLVPPLADVAVAVDMLAPTVPGSYRGYWQLFDAQGLALGPRAWIAVTAGLPSTSPSPESTVNATATAAVSVTPVTAPLEPTATETATAPFLGATSIRPGDRSAYVADVTIPDGTVLPPGKIFTKTWQIRNTGTRSWNSRYHWEFMAGAPMGTVRSVPAPLVSPGGTATLTVQMIAPNRSGSYRGFWQMASPSGEVFGAQAWVAVRVESPPSFTATPVATPTGKPGVTRTPLVSSSPSVSPNEPSATGVAQSTSVPWFGPATDHAFFAEGYTGDTYHEYLSLLNPRSRVLRAQISIYRTDGAMQMIAIRMAPLSRRTVDLNLLAPGSSTALKVDADSEAVVERAVFSGNGHVVAGAPLPGRRWYLAEAYVGAGYRDSLRIFNPYDRATEVTIEAYRGDGEVLFSHRKVNGGTRVNISLDDIAPYGSSGLQISSTESVVVESVVNSSGAAGPSAAMALPAPSRRWYFPDGGTTPGNDEYIALLNPGDQSATVWLTPVTGAGYRARRRLVVPAHARAVYVVRGVIRQSGLAAVLDSNRPIVAQEVRYAANGGVSVVNGTASPADSWGLAEGYTGNGFKQWITLLNPGDKIATVNIRLIGLEGVSYSTQVRELPRHRDFLSVNHLVPAGPVAAVVRSDHPIVVGRTMIFNAGKGLSTAVGVALAGG